jgi:hypothetical protein
LYQCEARKIADCKEWSKTKQSALIPQNEWILLLDQDETIHWIAVLRKMTLGKFGLLSK